MLKVLHGYAFKSENYVEKSQYRLATLGNFEEGNNSFKFNDDKATYYGADFPKEFVLHPGDLIMPLTEQVVGLFGNSAFVPKSDKYTFVLNQRVGKVVCDETKVDRYFVHYLLAMDLVKKQLEAKASGTQQRNISPNDIYDIDVFIPELDIQKRIGRFLYSIEIKQKNNTAICSDLEATAKLLYNYWFVQFDFPDENGKPYKFSGGKMVWNEELKREIPEGWEVKTLGEFISVIRGVSYKPSDELKSSSNNSISLLKSNNIQNGTINFEQPVLLPSEIANNDQWLTQGSVFITMSSGSKAHMGKTALVFKDLPFVFGAFCAKIDIAKSVRGYLSTYFRSEWFRTYIENVTAGTSINNIGNEQLTSIKLPFPNIEIQKQFENYLIPMYTQQGELEDENQQLASLRDFLLPMLMNGQVKVGKGAIQ